MTAIACLPVLATLLTVALLRRLHRSATTPVVLTGRARSLLGRRSSLPWSSEARRHAGRSPWRPAYLGRLLALGVLLFFRPVQRFVLGPLLGARRPTPDETARLETAWRSVLQRNRMRNSRYMVMVLPSDELNAFARAVRARQPYPVPIDDVLHGMAVFDAIVQSAQAGTIIAVDQH